VKAGNGIKVEQPVKKPQAEFDAAVKQAEADVKSTNQAVEQKTELVKQAMQAVDAAPDHKTREAATRRLEKASEDQRLALEAHKSAQQAVFEARTKAENNGK